MITNAIDFINKDFILSLGVIVEIFMCIAALYLVLKKEGLSNGESFCYSAIMTLGFFSISIQIFFFLKLQNSYYVFDILVLTFSSITLYRNRRPHPTYIQRASSFIRQNHLIVFILFPFLGYLFIQVLLVPPYNWDSMTYNLARVLMFQEEGSIFLKNFTLSHQAMFPWGWDVLAFLFLRFYTDYGLSIFSFISYIIILVGTYTLVQQVFKNIFLTNVTVLTIASLKLLILQSTTTKNDIATAALVVVCFLAGYNFLRTLKCMHLFMVFVTLLFGLTVKGYFAGFAVPFSLLFSIILLKQYSIKTLLHQLKVTFIRKTYFILPAGLAISLASNWAYNYFTFGNINGDIAVLKQHINETFLGMALNIARYSLQLLDLPTKYFGSFLVSLHNRAFGDFKYFSTQAAWGFFLPQNNIPFENVSWYGLLGFVLVVPALCYTSVKGKGYLRTISLTLFSYFLILCYTIVWMPWNGRFFSLVFAGSGLPVAFLLNKIIRKKNLVLFVLIIAFGTLLYTALLNKPKPFVAPHDIIEFAKNMKEFNFPYLKWKTIDSENRFLFKWLDTAFNRNAFYNQHFSNAEVLQTFINKIEPNKRLLLVGNSNFWVFPFLFTRQDLSVVVAKPDLIKLGEKRYDISNKADYSYLASEFDYMVCSGSTLCENLNADNKFCFATGTNSFRTPICILLF